jgi:hypothetical protein
MRRYKTACLYLHFIKIILLITNTKVPVGFPEQLIEYGVETRKGGAAYFLFLRTPACFLLSIEMRFQEMEKLSNGYQ